MTIHWISGSSKRCDRFNRWNMYRVRHDPTNTFYVVLFRIGRLLIARKA